MGRMAKEKLPITPAVRVLKAEKVEFTSHLYDYEEHGGTEVSARELGVDEKVMVRPCFRISELLW